MSTTMPERLIYKLTIEGAYTPASIPLQRLSEYLSDIAALMGEPASVHLERLEEGSTILAIAIDQPAIPKVEQRLSSITKGDPPDDLERAFENLNKLLADDNAQGTLSAFADEIQESVVLEFPGRNRPATIDYGVIRQQGTLDGVPVNVGGRDKTSHVILEDREKVYSGINVSRDMARKIAKHLYDDVIRLHGSGSWRRDQDGEWQLQRFRVDRFEVLDNSSLQDVLGGIRAISGSKWNEIDDTDAFLNELRDDTDDRPH